MFGIQFCICSPVMHLTCFLSQTDSNQHLKYESLAALVYYICMTGRIIIDTTELISANVEVPTMLTQVTLQPTKPEKVTTIHHHSVTEAIENNIIVI